MASLDEILPYQVQDFIKSVRRVDPGPTWSNYGPNAKSAAASSLLKSDNDSGALGSGVFGTDTSSGPAYDLDALNPDAPDNTLGKDAFMRLFIAQLTNQDPLNPLDGHEFVAQLATFSQLEQAYNTNELLTTIAAYQSSINTGQSLNLLGREVLATGDLVTLTQGKATPARYILPDQADVVVKILDANGEVVRTVEIGHQEAGTQEFVWDGCDDAGETLDDGGYSFQVVATTADDLPLEVLQICQGEVTGVRFADDGVPWLLVGPYDPGQVGPDGQPVDNRIEILLADVIQVHPGSGLDLENIEDLIGQFDFEDNLKTNLTNDLLSRFLDDLNK